MAHLPRESAARGRAGLRPGQALGQLRLEHLGEPPVEAGEGHVPQERDARAPPDLPHPVHALGPGVNEQRAELPAELAS